MVIGFSNNTAWNHLVTYGFVATFRPKRANSHGTDWVNRGRGEEKEFDCHIIELGKVEFGEDETVLEKCAEISGFGSKETWKHAIESLHGELPEEGFVYLVRKVS